MPYQEGEEVEVAVEELYTEKHVPPATLKAQLGPDVWGGNTSPSRSAGIRGTDASCSTSTPIPLRE
jgi:hypothetical protein